MVSSVGTKREGDETARGRNDHKTLEKYISNILGSKRDSMCLNYLKNISRLVKRVSLRPSN
jgi:hemerythrin superfamily protein